jgi:hypothetical protein
MSKINIQTGPNSLSVLLAKVTLVRTAQLPQILFFTLNGMLEVWMVSIFGKYKNYTNCLVRIVDMFFARVDVDIVVLLVPLVLHG